ncbi:MAG: hypothetical protein DWQ07_25335 [Chloroflexi bacterium]|nr:MAG: hypothetical protein DWQ07_25335 [Chloroflexota bacterium]MBL1196140.1 hypothetical protein [Chloroflexota bacterium]NOH13433.1 hypothetical protein [Chloroflexota bacterium]
MNEVGGEDFGYVSNILSSLFQSLTCLLDCLNSTPIVKPNEVQASVVENGFSCGIISIAVNLLESAINRSKYLKGQEPKGNPVEYVREVTNDDKLSDELDEIYAARDAIVHNHLWEAKIKWENGLMKFGGIPKLVKGYGNPRFRKVLDAGTRKTKRIRLNLFPPRIWRRDAYLILEVVNRALQAIGEIDEVDYTQNYLNINGQVLRFSELAEQLEIPEENE